ncbi:hypothetical protein HR060_13705 [Catenovulum sp. SM1970]|uniref:hypothetical protein n=1 Tax=Marinifaba aquimaris TaxID=2741323 RepID=UPI0015723091|nr:hypothetical protein [Marinifaba aquimaris]NTS77910.1 hypothetical protein [Marinifaba aquimaris]
MSLTKAEKENLRAFLSAVYGNQVNGWSMNNDVFNLTFKMLEDSRKCSDLMDYVPRPMALGQAPINYVRKSIRETLLRKLKNNKAHYRACIGVVANKKKTKIYMAAMGY